MVRYAITGDQPALADARLAAADARHWAATGVDFVQLRARLLDAGDLATLARQLLPALGSARLLINGRADVAIAVGAAGVHLTARPGELSPKQVRLLFARAGLGQPIISASCHTLAEVERARDASVDFILSGPVFEKRVHNEVVTEGIGLEALRQACIAASPVQVLALGGITLENTPQCLQAGAAGIAAIRLFQP